MNHDLFALSVHDSKEELRNSPVPSGAMVVERED